MVTITYEALNDLTHEVGESISKTTGIPKEHLDLIQLNDSLTAYMDRFGVLYEDEENDDPQ